MASPNKRKSMDVMKLMMSDFNVTMEGDTGTDFEVEFQGPKDTAYEGGNWTVNVSLPSQYPYRSPSIGFKNRIFHPNVDFRSGTICLDVINQTWSPMYDLVNIFQVFLPQLLSYPNPADPLNNEAASLLLSDPEKYNEKVRELVRIHAKITSSKVVFKADAKPDVHPDAEAEAFSPKDVSQKFPNSFSSTDTCSVGISAVESPRGKMFSANDYIDSDGDHEGYHCSEEEGGGIDQEMFDFEV